MASGRPSIALLRWLIAAFGAALLVLTVCGAWFYHVHEQDFRQSAFDRLSAIFRLKTEQITAWRGERLAEAARLSESPFLTRSVARFLADRDDEIAAELRIRFRSLVRNSHYIDVLLVDPDGRVQLSLNGHTDMLDGYASPLAEALRDRAPAFGELHDYPPDKTIHVCTVAPVVTGEGSSARSIGAIVLITDARQHLFPLIQTSPTLSKTGECLLVRRDGEDMLFLSELRHQPDAPLKLRIPLSRTDVLGVKAVLGVQGAHEGKDYRGIEVVAIIGPVPGSPWFMVSKVDSVEVFASWRGRAALILSVILLTGGTLAAIVLAIRQHQVKAHFQRLYAAELRLHETLARQGVTLRSVGDGIIATDGRGRVEMLNPVAEKLTGWSQADAAGRPCSEIFRIINRETRDTVEDPVAKVLGNGNTEILARHTLLITRHGTEVPIADSAAPIHDDQGRITGVVIVFRDETQETRANQELRESEERYRTLFEGAGDGIFIVDVETRRFLRVNRQACLRLGYTEAELLAMTPNDLEVPEDAQCADDRLRLLRERGTLVFAVTHITKDGARIPWEIGCHTLLYKGRTARICIARDLTERKKAEQALDQSRRRFISLAGQAPVGIFETDGHGNCLFVNDRWSEIAGMSPEEAQGRRWIKALHPEDRDRVFQEARAAAAREQEFKMEFRFLAPDGRTKWVIANARANTDDEGRTVGYFGSLQDITERKEHERLISSNEALYKCLHELSEMTDVSGDDIARAALEQAVVLTGSGIGYLHFLHEDQVNLELFHWTESVLKVCQAGRQRCYPLALSGVWADCLRTGEPAIHNDYPSLSERRGMPEGHVPVSRHLSIPVFGEGRIQAVVGVGNKAEPYDALDARKLQRFFSGVWQILGRRKAEAALRDSQALLSQTQAIGMVGGWSINLDTRVSSWTEEARRLLGFTGAPDLERAVDLFEPADRLVLAEAVRKARNAGKPFDLDLRLASSEEGRRWVRLIGQRADADEEQVLSGVVQDISHRKSLDDLREDIDRIARHDLKTPLNGIIGLPQVIKYDTNITDEQREMLQMIEDSGNRMLNMINLTLDLFKMESGKYEFTPVTFDLLRLVRKAVADLRSLIQASELSVHITMDGRPVEALGESSLCYSVFANLLKNAIESSPSGDVVTVALGTDDGCRVDIQNRGVVPDEIRPMFFEKYTTLGKRGGTGLGTYSARLMARTMGGDVELDTSEPGATTVTVRLPCPRNEA